MAARLPRSFPPRADIPEPDQETIIVVPSVMTFEAELRYLG